MDLFDEVWGSLLPIGRCGETGGYRRYAWSAADLACRAWFAAQAAEAGLTVDTDRAGNQWAWWGSPGPGAVVTGSHLDSVPDGGAYDGPLGVVSALLAVRALRERGVTPHRPLAVVAFGDEEGARFGVACAGSRLLTGDLEAAVAARLTDADGVTMADAVRAAGVLGGDFALGGGPDPGGDTGPGDRHPLRADPERLAMVGAFVELHVEQGRRLADLGAAVGVATAIWPHGRWRFTFTGRADHAGTTLLADRRDPMLPYAHAVLAAREAAARLGSLATYGRVRVVPNGTNAIPSAVHAWLDARAPDAATLRDTVAAVTDAARRACAAEGVELVTEQQSVSPPVAFDPVLRDRVAAAASTALAAQVPAVPTGAGHDAGVLAAHRPTAMLFVRNPDGTSHSPREGCDYGDARAGIRALTGVLADLVSRRTLP